MLLAGKWHVFHRQIHGRDPEIVGKLPIPTIQKELITFFMHDLGRLEDKYEYIMDLMPEVQDITKILADPTKHLTKSQITDLTHQLCSYTTYIAVYDPLTNQIDTLYYDIPISYLKEMSIDATQMKSIHSLILDNCSFLDLTKTSNPEWDAV